MQPRPGIITHARTDDARCQRHAAAVPLLYHHLDPVGAAPVEHVLADAVVVGDHVAQIVKDHTAAERLERLGAAALQIKLHERDDGASCRFEHQLGDGLVDEQAGAGGGGRGDGGGGRGGGGGGRCHEGGAAR